MSRLEVHAQAAQLARRGATLRSVDEGENVVVLFEHYSPPNGAAYAPSTLDAFAFLVPAVFPDASPDPTGFFVRPADIRVVRTKAAPQSTSAAMLLGMPALKFSWSPKTFKWNPDTDNLETHLATLEKRFLLGT